MDYSSLLKELAALLEGESDYIANAANVSAFIFENVEDLNWVGFYFLRKEELVVGPFQGKIACTRIGLTRGVCGECFSKKKVINVPDVEDFSDHIVCDSASASELAVPLVYKGECIGVFDIDSPELERFDEELSGFLTSAAQIYVASCDLNAYTIS